ncbi:MAG: phosphatidylcholine/phosphatidylserine synthase [Sphingomonadales bacterium]
MADPAPRRRRGIPLRALIPNAVTVLALCFGLTGVRFAIGGEWEKAVAAVVLAGVLDGIDGRIARLLKGTSRFGAELDSLSDLTAFGVAPALILYLWALQYLPGVGWLVALAHAVTCALRLARFNARIDDDNQPHKRLGYLTGVPAPMGAGLALTPVAFSFWLPMPIMDDLAVRVPVATAVLAATAFLMASSLPTFSWGSIRVRPAWRLPALAGVGLFAGALFTAPWQTLSVVGLVYAATIPFAVASYARMKRREATSG